MVIKYTCKRRDVKIFLPTSLYPVNIGFMLLTLFGKAPPTYIHTYMQIALLTHEREVVYHTSLGVITYARRLYQRAALRSNASRV